MAKSGRDAMSNSPRTVRGHAQSAASGKPHGATFGNAAAKPKSPTKQRGSGFNAYGAGAQRGGSK